MPRLWLRLEGVNRRQRYNMAGSFAYGLEAAAHLELAPRISAEFGAAFQWGNARRESDGTRPPLLQRPTRQLRAALDFQPINGIDLRAEAVHVGASLDLADDGAVRQLPSSTAVNLRALVDLIESAALGRLSLVLAADNVSDALVLPQLGLPAPGRTLTAGIRVGARK